MYQGVLIKMKTEYTDPVNYYLVFKNDFIHVNQLLDREVGISFVSYECLNCHLDKPIYRQGFCKSCFFETASAGDWIMRPELSKAHLDQEDRDLEFERAVQLQPHVVYLALSSEVKVGVTRKAQIPTRWIDQGAHQAIEVVEVPNRYLAGITEVALKAHMTDKTNWRKILTNDLATADLVAEKDRLDDFLPEEVKPYYLDTNKKVYTIGYPVLEYPKKVKSLNLEKTPEYRGKLKGIKGQYLLFEDSTVFNVRGSEGYVVDLVIV
ncbi:DUF2797 domain-containing protein [Sinomicrobium soli]|uniref:DUF2797 domain-containing protein n=1 Tax=Sinomicrobium sp. N-1-3-6 TaxID=2219864 RepID=UPI000DCE8DB6|nr:DUF2797 domain-containing protein [Sinomicrobium sp. N-1-3-6]RAV27913.1 DUF2797 domain-containing protein [Sinomicrobium sp. N-1-3-6]